MRNLLGVLLILITTNIHAQDFKAFNLGAIAGLEFNEEKTTIAADGFYQDHWWAVGGMVALNYRLSSTVNEDGCQCSNEKKLRVGYRVYGEAYGCDVQKNKVAPYIFIGLEQLNELYGGIGVLWNIESQTQLRAFLKNDRQFGLAVKRIFDLEGSFRN